MLDTNLLRDEARKCRELAALCSLPDMAAELLAIAEHFIRKAAEEEAGDAARVPIPCAVPIGAG